MSFRIDAVRPNVARDTRRVAACLIRQVAVLACWYALVDAGTVALAPFDRHAVQAAEPVAPTATEAEAGAEKFFEEQVHPILAKRCYECHAATKQESELRLDSREAVLKGGASGEPAAVPKDPAASLLLRAVRHEGDVQMPPDFRMPDAEVQLLSRWVQLGMPWSARLASSQARTVVEQAAHDRQRHWAYQPVRRPDFPAVRDADWPATGLDHFILEALEARELSPSAEADRRTLIRRLSFDLLGLPPSPEEVDAFLADSAPDAYERLVDRLLASPRYGERWGRHWLDVARYADTRGYAFANERRYPYAYTYRDYVIAAWNDDKGYDDFVLEQLAADQLPIAERRSLAALGFLTTGRRFNNRQDDLDDQIDVVCRGLLGLTVSCARCHDHKYDVVPSADYYALYGVFANSEEPKELPLIGDPQDGAAYAEFEKELNQRRVALENFRRDKRLEVMRTARERVTEYLERVIQLPPDFKPDREGARSLGPEELRPRLIERWHAFIRQRAAKSDPVFGPWGELVAIPAERLADEAPQVLDRWRQLPPGNEPGQLSAAIRAELSGHPITSRADVARAYGRALTAVYQQCVALGGQDDSIGKLPADVRPLGEILLGEHSPTRIAPEDMRFFLNRADRNKERDLEKKIESFQASSPAAPPRAMVLQDVAAPQDARILVRGNPARQGDVVPRQFLLVLSRSERTPFQHGSGRLDLAREIVHPDNPLTRRVLANRVWMHHFGHSLVRTPSDFGIRCEPPTHPALLDYLASLLLDRDWSLKSLHREIVLSSTYRQASSGKGASPRAAEIDPENRLYWRMNRQRLEFEPLRDTLLSVAGRLEMDMGGRSDNLVSEPFTRRRTVYGFIDRQDLPNLLRVFDFASPDQSQAQRPRTIVPQQALFLMNSPFVAELAESLASRPEIAAASEPADKMKMLYRVVFQREPGSRELDLALEYVQAGSTEDDDARREAWKQWAQLLLMTNELAFVD